MKKAILGLLVLTLGSLAQAVPCSYTTFTPEFLKEKLLYSLNEAGLSNIHKESKDGDVIVHNYRIVRETGVVGTVDLREGARGLSRELVITDNRGVRVLRVVEAKKGVARTEIEMFSDLDNRPKIPHLTILKFTGNSTYHYVGVKDEGITVFYIEFEDLWKQAKETLLSEKAAKEFKFDTRLERFQFLVSQSAMLAPYTKYFKVVERNGQYEILGTLPSNFVHQELLNLGWKELNATLRFRGRIDTRLAVLPAEEPSCRDHVR